MNKFKGLRLTKRGEAVRDTLAVILAAGLFFPVLSLIIAAAHTIGLN
jgi:hypothetical protein